MFQLFLSSELFSRRAQKALVFVLSLFFYLSGSVTLPGRAGAVSPVPYEIEKEHERKALETPADKDIACNVAISYTKGQNGKANYQVSTFFDDATSKIKAFERTIEAIADKLSEEDISDVVIKCAFPIQGRKEQ